MVEFPFVAGKASNEQKRFLDALFEAANVQLKYLRDGVISGEMVRAVKAVFKKHALEQYDVYPPMHGIILAHEHLFIDLRNQFTEFGDSEKRRLSYEKLRMGNLDLVRRNPYAIRDNLLLDELEVAVAEVNAFAALGGKTIVDCTSIGIQRDPAERGFAGGIFARDIDRVRVIKNILDWGYKKQILVTNDICLKSMLQHYGGWGYDHILGNIACL